MEDYKRNKAKKMFTQANSGEDSIKGASVRFNTERPRSSSIDSLSEEI